MDFRGTLGAYILRGGDEAGMVPILMKKPSIASLKDVELDAFVDKALEVTRLRSSANATFASHPTKKPRARP